MKITNNLNLNCIFIVSIPRFSLIINPIIFLKLISWFRLQWYRKWNILSNTFLLSNVVNWRPVVELRVFFDWQVFAIFGWFMSFCHFLRVSTIFWLIFEFPSWSHFSFFVDSIFFSLFVWFFLWMGVWVCSIMDLDLFFFVNKNLFFFFA